MEVRVATIEDRLLLGDNNRLNAGGEGEIYNLPPEKLVKVYHEDQLTSSRQQKVLDLCSRYETYKGLFNQDQYAFPQVPVSRISRNKKEDNEIVVAVQRPCFKLPLEAVKVEQNFPFSALL
jgi:hypothetical protein